MISRRIVIAGGLLAGATGLFGQPPLDVQGLNDLVFGETLATAQKTYPGVFQPVKVGKHSAKDFVERLRAPKYPVGDMFMVLSLYTLGDADGIARMDLSLRDDDHASTRGLYLLDVFRGIFGKAQQQRLSGPPRSDFSALYVWKFASSTITLVWEGDMVFRVELLPA